MLQFRCMETGNVMEQRRRLVARLRYSLCAEQKARVSWLREVPHSSAGEGRKERQKHTTGFCEAKAEKAELPIDKATSSRKSSTGDTDASDFWQTDRISAEI